jgi:hypothetical protein
MKLVCVSFLTRTGPHDGAENGCNTHIQQSGIPPSWSHMEVEAKMISLRQRSDYLGATLSEVIACEKQ